jgi:hypothetical protein
MWSSSHWLTYLILGLDITQPTILSILQHSYNRHRMRLVFKEIIRHNKRKWSHLHRFPASAFIAWKREHIIFFSNQDIQMGPTIVRNRRSINRCTRIYFRGHYPQENISWHLESSISPGPFFVQKDGTQREITETEFFKKIRAQGIYAGRSLLIPSE